jgi:hypothetical protein
MTRPSDELLSAYLDGELSASQRSEVEDRLAANLTDRELLAELQALRQEVAALPRYQARRDFVDRVVAAATKAKAEQDAANTPLEPVSSKRKRRAAYYVLPAIAAAAALLVMMAPWRGPTDNVARSDPQHPEPGQAIAKDLPGASTPVGPLAAVLGGEMPGQDEGVVLRLRLPPDHPTVQALDAALLAAGIGHRPASDTASGAMQIGAAYRRQVEERGADGEDTRVAADVVYVEATLAQLEAALAALVGQNGEPVVRAEARLAFIPPANAESGEGEGESQARGQSTAPGGQPFAQRLNAGMFRLRPRHDAPLPAASGEKVDPQAPLRVLILVERAEPAP